MDNKHVLVFGASSGIGLAACDRLLSTGAVVTLAARNESRLCAVTDELATRYSPQKIRSVVADANDYEQVCVAVKHATDTKDELQACLVVPGGSDGYRSVLKTDEAVLQRDLLQNVLPAANVTRAAFNSMKHNGGSIVLISSIAAVNASPYLASYCAGKAALEAWMRSAAVELAEHRIRINAVRPGLTRTAATEGMFANADVLALFTEDIPLARGGKPEDIAPMLSLLISDDSNWITGQAITIDGGNNLRAQPFKAMQPFLID